jgi:hypothetical protein
MNRQIVIPNSKGEIEEATEVLVKESIERWTELTLEDGSTLLLKAQPVVIARLNNKYDAEGRPLYWIQTATPVIKYKHIPDELFEVSEKKDKPTLELVNQEH